MLTSHKTRVVYLGKPEAVQAADGASQSLANIEHMDLARAWAKWNGQRGTERAEWEAADPGTRDRVPPRAVPPPPVAFRRKSPPAWMQARGVTA